MAYVALCFYVAHHERSVPVGFSKLVCGLFLDHAYGSYHESGVTIVFCIPNLPADCFSIMILVRCARGLGYIVLPCCPS